MREKISDNLPVPLTSFIGRERELAEVRRLLGTSRMLTLVGPGGCGKTRLALQVAADLSDEFPQGVWFTDLAPIADPALVPQVIAGALRIREQPGRTFVEALSEFVNERKCLLVLDNCEHLREACAQLARTLLSACPQVQILTTSREALGLEGEVVWLVPSLSMPESGQASRVSDLEKYDSTRLFVERARTRLSSFEPTGENAAAIARVCQRLDGIPLAIELAAARVNVLTVEQAAARLDDRFTWLTSNNPTVTLPRHRTLRAAIDWSYELLFEKERVLFRRLAVFAGGFTLDAAEAVCEGDGLVHDEILNVLSQLVSKSLVVAETLQRREARYYLLETIRQYALERLGESSEVMLTRNHHLDFFLRLAEGAETQLPGPDQGIWVQRFEEELENLRVALAWSKTGGQQAEMGLRLAAALWRFWTVHYLGEGRRHLADLLSLDLAGSNESTRAKALAAAADLANRQGDFLSARPLWEKSLALEQNLGNQVRVAHSLRGLGNIAFAQGDLLSARQNYEQSLEISRELADMNGLAWSLSNLGLVAWNDGDNVQARRLFEESLIHRRELNDQGGVGYVLNLLGMVAWSERDYPRMRALNEESLAIQRGSNDFWNIAYSLDGLGLSALGEHHYPLAWSYFDESLTLFRQLDDKWGISYALERFAALAEAQMQPIASARLFGAAEALREAIRLPAQPAEHREHDRIVAAVRATISLRQFETAWTHGRALTLEQAFEQVRALGTHTQQTAEPSPPTGSQQALNEPLTERESEVLNLVAMGLSNQEIAQRLIVAPSTVKWYIQNVYTKLDVHSRTQALARAKQVRLL